MVAYYKTTDGGDNWSGPTALSDPPAGSTINVTSVWYDRWTPGSVGTKIHIVVVGTNADMLEYNYLDTNGDSERSGGWVSVLDVKAFNTDSSPPSVTVATDGLVYALGVGADGTNDVKVYSSDDDGATWTDTSFSPFTENDSDIMQIVPLPGGDVLVLYQDISADDLLSARYSTGADTWGNTQTLNANFVEGANGYSQFNATVVSSTAAVYVAGVNDIETAGGDVEVYKYNESANTWAALTNPVTNSALLHDVAIGVDSDTDDLYIVYVEGTGGSTNILKTSSTDDGTSWVPTTQLNDVTSNVDVVHVDINASSGDRLYAVWWNQGLDDILGNTAFPVPVNLFEEDTETAAFAEILGINFPKSDTGSFAETLGTTVAGVKSDTSSLADAIALAVSKSLAETMGLTDSAAIGLVATDSASFADTLQNVLTASKTDSATFVDAVTRVLGLGDTEVLAFVENAVAAFLSTASDSQSFVDSVVWSIGASRSDAEAIVDSAIGAVAMSRSEAATLAESVAIGIPTSEAASLNDQALAAISSLITDGATLADAQTLAVGIPRSEALSMAESVATGLANSDSLSTLESVVSALSKVVADSTTVGETLGTALTMLQSESATFTESASSAFSLSRSDSTSLAETLLQTVGASRSDTATAVDAAVLQVQKIASDGVSVVEDLAVGIAVSDAQSLVDNALAALSLPRSDAEAFAEAAAIAVSISDSEVVSFVESAAVLWPVADSGSVAESTVAVLGLGRTESESLVDSITKVASMSRADIQSFVEEADIGFGRSESAGISELIAAVFGVTRSDSLGTLESIARQITSGRSDSLSFGEIIDSVLGRAPSDASSFVDAIVTAVGAGRTESPSIAEAIGLAVSSGLADGLSFGETVGIGRSVSDASSFVAAIGLGRTETASFVDAVAQSSAFARTDSSTFVDAVVAGLGTGRADSTSFAEVLAALLGTPRADSATFADSVAAAVGSVSSDSKSFSDTIAVVLGAVRADSGVFSEDSASAIGSGQSDTGTFADSVASTLGSSAGDSQAFVDSIATVLASLRADSGSFAETLAALIGSGRSDSATFSDLLVWTLGADATDSSSFADAIAAAIGTGRTESSSITEAVAVSVGMGLSEPLTVGEAIEFFFGLSDVESADSGSFAETIAAAIGVGRTDSQSFTETVAQISSFPRADSSTFVDTLVSGLSIGRSDSTTFFDALAATMGSSHTDLASVTDSIAATVGSTSSDTKNFSDAIAIVLGAVRTESGTFAEAAAAATGSARSDTATLSDLLAWTLGADATDSSSLAEAIAAAIGAGRTESSSITEAVAVSIGIGLSESLTVAEVIESVFALADVDRADSGSFAEIIASAIFSGRSEVVGLGEGSLADVSVGNVVSTVFTDDVQSGLGSAKVDSFGLSDFAAPGFPRTESLSPNESQRFTTSFGRGETQTIVDQLTTDVSKLSDVSVTISEGADPIFEGDDLTFTVVVDNEGPSLARDVVLVVTLPLFEQLQLVSQASDRGECVTSGAVVTCTLGNLDINDSSVSTYTLRATPGAAVRTVLTSVSVTHTFEESFSPNNIDFADTLIKERLLTDLSVTAAAVPNPVPAGGILAYAFTVTNLGPGRAENVPLALDLDSAVTIVSISPSQGSCDSNGNAITCNVGHLESGTAATVSVDAVPNVASGGSTITSTAVSQAPAEVFQLDTVTANNTSTVATSVVASADLSVSLAAPANGTVADREFQYQAVATNRGSSTSTAVSLQLVLADGLEFSTSTASQGNCSHASGTVTCDLGLISPLGDASVTVEALPTVTVPVGQTTTVTSTASISAPESDPDLSNNSATTTVEIFHDEDVDGVGDPIEDLAPNSGDGNDDGVKDSQQSNVTSLLNSVDDRYVTLESPETTQLASVEATGNPSVDDAPDESFPMGFFDFEIKDVGVGATSTVTLIFPEGTVTLTYWKYGPTTADPTDHWYEFPYDGTTGAVIDDNEVTLHFVDGLRGDDDLTANGKVIDVGVPVLSSADLAVTSTSPSSALAGAQIKFEYDISNAGPSAAHNVVLTDQLPTGLAFVTAEASQGTCTYDSGLRRLTCDLGTIANAATSTVSLTVTASGSLNGSTVKNDASVAASEDDSKAANDSSSTSVEITGNSDVSVSISDSSDPVEAGTLVTYTVTVQNNGPTTATGVTLTDSIPSGLLFSSVSSGQGTCSQASGTVTCDVGTLNSGSKAEVKIQANALASADDSKVVNSTSVTSTSSDANSLNNTASATTVVGDSVDLEVVSVTHSPAPAEVGRLVTFVGDVQNSGLIEATNTKVTVTVPFGNEFYSASATGGSCEVLVLGLVTCDLGNLPAGTTGITVTVRMRPAAQAITKVTFTILSDEDDHDPNNNVVAVFSGATQRIELTPAAPAAPGGLVPIETEVGSVALVLPGAAGAVESSDGLVRLELPANESTEPIVVRLQVVPASSVPAELAGLITRYALIEFFNILGLPIIDYTLSTAAETTFVITNDDLAEMGGIQAFTLEHARGNLGVLRYDQTEGLWVIQETQVGTNPETLTSVVLIFAGTKTYYAMVWNPEGLITELEPTSTPEPTLTPEPTSTPEPTPTPEPTSTPLATPTPAPTSTPFPTPDVGPTSTPLPTPDVGPTSTPLPSPFETPEAPIVPPGAGSGLLPGGSAFEGSGPRSPIFTVDAWKELGKWLGLVGGITAALGASGYLLVTRGERYGGAVVLATGLFIMVVDKSAPVAASAAKLPASALDAVRVSGIHVLISVLDFGEQLITRPGATLGRWLRVR